MIMIPSFLIRKTKFITPWSSGQEIMKYEDINVRDTKLKDWYAYVWADGDQSSKYKCAEKNMNSLLETT